MTIPKESYVWEKVKHELENASLAIDQEFERTANNWLSCFGSVLFRIEIYVAEAYSDRELSATKYRLCQDKVELAKQVLAEMRPLYPNKHPLPPRDVRQRLLGLLDDIVEVA